MSSIDVVPPVRGLDAPAALVIDGEPVLGRGPTIAVEDPATGRVLREISAATDAQAADAVLAARVAFDDGRWSGLPPFQRATALHALADLLEEEGPELLDLAVGEVGTPISLARTLHLQLPLEVLRWYADAAAVDRTESLPLRGEDAVPNAALVHYLPAGVVAAITPYNYPLFLACQKVGAALAAGCTTVLMPSPLTPLVTLRFGELASRVLPAGALNVVVGGPEVGRLVTEHAGVDVVSFTGSVPVGASIMRQAAQTIKGVVLELGGKSANLLLPGTDLAATLGAVHGRYLRNAGQGCASPTRILVERSRMDEVVERSREIYASIALGDPRDERTHVGPLVSAAQRARVQGHVDAALAAGAERLSDVREVPDEGFFLSPSLIGGVDNGAEICRQELFGPVGVLLPYDDVDEAVAIANDSAYGLSGNVFGPSIPEAIAVAKRIRSGHVTVNGGAGMRPDAPFGGLRLSGVGREGGEWGIREFLEPQLIQWPVAW